MDVDVDVSATVIRRKSTDPRVSTRWRRACRTERMPRGVMFVREMSSGQVLG